MSKPAATLKCLAAWAGTVESIAEDTFMARLRRTDVPSVNDEFADFDVDEVPEGDRDLLSNGAQFYWSIGMLTMPTGQVSAYSGLSFRRLPWTAVEAEEADRAKWEFDSFFRTGPSNESAEQQRI